LDFWTKMEPKGLLSAYLQLSKSKLTILITSTGTLQLVVLAFLGTALLSSSANACNQLLEAPYDAQMKRTQQRVLVVHRFSPLHALSFAGVTGMAGVYALYMYANPLSASLGVLNLALYAGIYTPLKRAHIACTWAGALVGAIPPLMGYSAATGTIDASALCLAAILYSWQFPHFNGLSWNLRGDYSKAGYRVMCVTNERLCRVTSLRHSLALVGLCSFAAPFTNLTTITFAFDSLPINFYMCWLAYKFYKGPDAQNSRRLFFYSLFYLPLMLILMVISNYGRNDARGIISAFKFVHSLKNLSVSGSVFL
uniref:Heme O synthase n=1 Tax=Angiostrongylus cantonensis TaxID=6313 RepID=A0A0K0DMR5_ANGCA